MWNTNSVPKRDIQEQWCCPSKHLCGSFVLPTAKLRCFSTHTFYYFWRSNILSVKYTNWPVWKNSLNWFSSIYSEHVFQDQLSSISSCPVFLKDKTKLLSDNTETIRHKQRAQSLKKGHASIFEDGQVEWCFPLHIPHLSEWHPLLP